MNWIVLIGTCLLYLSPSPVISQSGMSDIAKKFGPLNKVQSGINIHFTVGHQKDLDMIAYAGFKYVRMDFVWQNTERIKGTYNWADYDELTANLSKRGLRAIYILDYSNSLYEDQVESKDPITGEVQKGIASPQHPESLAAFSKWAAAAASHFKDYNIIWEIWNEPNITFWKPRPDVEQYISLAKATCRAVRSVVPHAVIIGPGTSQVPLPFLESFLASGVLEYLDAVSVHPYRNYSMPPETAVTDYLNLRGLIDRYTPGGKSEIPIISSEWGYSSAVKGLSAETQAAYIVRMQLANMLYNIPISVWYDWKNDGDDPVNFEHNCGTVSSDLKPKPAYTAIQTLNYQIKGFTFLRRIEQKSENDFILLFKNDSGIFKISAWTIDQSHTIAVDKLIPVTATAKAADWKGDKFQIKTDQDRLVLDLNYLPLYITLPSEWKIN